MSPHTCAVSGITFKTKNKTQDELYDLGYLHGLIRAKKAFEELSADKAYLFVEKLIKEYKK